MLLALALLFGGGLVVFSILRPMKQTAGEAAPSAGVVLGTPLALGVMRFATGLNTLRVARVERVTRKVSALVFIGAGLFMLWNLVTATWG